MVKNYTIIKTYLSSIYNFLSERPITPLNNKKDETLPKIRLSNILL